MAPPAGVYQYSPIFCRGGGGEVGATKALSVSTMMRRGRPWWRGCAPPLRAASAKCVESCERWSPWQPLGWLAPGFDGERGGKKRKQSYRAALNVTVGEPGKEKNRKNHWGGGTTCTNMAVIKNKRPYNLDTITVGTATFRTIKAISALANPKVTDPPQGKQTLDCIVIALSVRVL